MGTGAAAIVPGSPAPARLSAAGPVAVATGVAVGGAGVSGPSATTLVATAIRPPACQRGLATACLVVVTQADAGRTLRLRVGSRIRLVLQGSAGFGWGAAHSSNPRVLRPTPDPLMTPIPIGWIRTDFAVVRGGRATVTAVQAPACAADHPPCLAPDRLFSLMVVAIR